MLDKKAWFTISVQIPPKGIHWGRGHGFALASRVSPYQTKPKMSLYPVALRRPFIGTNGTNGPNPKKQLQTIIHPSTNFTGDSMHSGRKSSPGIRQTQIHPSGYQIVPL